MIDNEEFEKRMEVAEREVIKIAIRSGISIVLSIIMFILVLARAL